MKTEKNCYCQSAQCVHRIGNFCEIYKLKINGTCVCDKCEYEEKEKEE